MVFMTTVTSTSAARAIQRTFGAVLIFVAAAVAQSATVFPQLSVLSSPWGTYGGDPQHTGMSRFPSASMDQVLWSFDIDPTNTQSAGGEILAHYGSPVVSSKNTVIFPVARQSDTTYSFYAVNGRTGAEIWHFDTDFTQPPTDWTPVVEGSILNKNKYAMPGIGGSVYVRNNIDKPSMPVQQFFFYGAANHDANQSWCDANIRITTPIMAGGNGAMWFEYYVGDAFDPYAPVTFPAGFPALGRGGVARVDADGNGTWVNAAAAAGDPAVTFSATNHAPALSNDGKSVYVAVKFDYFRSPGYLLKLNATTLATQAKVQPSDPWGGPGVLTAFHLDSSACPMVGPDGDVYIGVFGNGYYTYYRESHGWMKHYDSNLNPKGADGAFGWDDTASIVPASAVPQYTGTSTYLILTKYNNYKYTDFGWPYYYDSGADGRNQVAILDPNDAGAIDRQAANPVSFVSPAQVPVMKPVIAVMGLTPDDPSVPGSVSEWCINSAAVDPFNKCAIVNCEDGVCYKWDFASNSLGPVHGSITGVPLNSPTGEAYTPTVIGPDGTVYAINAHRLYAIGPLP